VLPLNPELPYYYAFSHLFEFIGPRRLRLLKARYGSLKESWERLTAEDLLHLGLGPEKQGLFWLKKRKVLLTSWAKLANLGIRFLSEEDPAFPYNLLPLDDRPAWLYVRGDLRPADSLSLAVVGSRKMTNYGRLVIDTLVPELVRYGVTIVSGLAFGVDSWAHQVALNSGGRTLAVLASGVDNITPRSQTPLAERLIRGGQGAILSEFPLGTSPQPFYFPIRNRLLSGLSLGVLVVEAAQKSGSLLTAGHALDQGREVFVVPGSVFSLQSEGANRLLKEGAKLVTRASDILEELEIFGRRRQEEAKQKWPLASEEEKALWSLLTREPLPLDEVIRQSGLSVSQVNAALTVMEMKGMVKSVAGTQFCRI